mgnify:CR=1 FL=1
MDNQQIITYFQILKRLRSSLGLNHEMQCNKWLEMYSRLSSDTPAFWNAEKDLPILLALINPCFYYDKTGRNIGEDLVIKHSKRRFQSKSSIYGCRINFLIPSAVCPYYHKGVKLTHDHMWPHSLGGATREDNRLPICDVCNKQKSNSPLLFPGTRVPVWLQNRAAKLFQLKSRNFI